MNWRHFLIFNALGGALWGLFWGFVFSWRRRLIAGECNGNRTKARKNLLNLFQPIRIESDLFAMAQKDAATQHSANDVSDVVAENCTEPGKKQEPGKRYVASSGEHGRNDQQ
jgi:hypothetical protein